LLDRGVLREMCDGCGWSAREFRDFYLRGAAHLLAELKEAVAAAEHREIERIAHGWAGSTATAGVVGLVPALRRIEAAAREGRIEEDGLDEVESGLARVRAELDRWCEAATPGGLNSPAGGASPS